MITVDANKQLQAVHHRMPCLLPFDRVEEYLEAEEPPKKLVRPWEGRLRVDPPPG